MTASEELALVDAAIEAILGGKVASLGARERQLAYLPLRDLWARKAVLEAQVRQAASGGCYAAQFRKVE